MSLKSVTGSGGVISTMLCLPTGRKGTEVREEGNDDLEPDHVYKLGPQGQINFSSGIMEAVYSVFSPVLFSLQAAGLLVVFHSHMEGGDLSLTASSITSLLPGCHGCVQRHKPLDIRLEHWGSFFFPISLFSSSPQPPPHPFLSLCFALILCSLLQLFPSFLIFSLKTG